MAHARDEDRTTGQTARRLRTATMAPRRTVTRGRVTPAYAAPGGRVRVSADTIDASAQCLSQAARRSADEA